MSSYTFIGQDLWLWAPFIALTPPTRYLWLTLFASPEAKRTPPGLWSGGVGVIAESAHMPTLECIEGLNELTDHRLIERDDQRRVLRMTRLPDRYERPTNGRVIRSWWNMFRGIPACPVRDRWVDLLRWLIGPAMSNDHEKAWLDTFATVDLSTAYPQPQRLPVDEPQIVAPVTGPIQGTLFSDERSGTSDTNTDTNRDQGSGIRDQVRDQSSEASPAPRLLAVIDGGLPAAPREPGAAPRPTGRRIL